mmetsp:Transcript_25120/g.65524  ORF Transcript_25120/g.65524 Transcript_25120/m.65524 type:complete len:394 (+) Transcript_25120:2-1183(+)
MAAVAAVGVAAACSSDLDCGLLGTCSGGACNCFKGYRGITCAELDLVPAPPTAGLRQRGNHSNWCGTILQDEVDPTKWHMYNSDFAGCGLGIWITGSRVIHTTAKGSPLGPYTPTGEVAVAGEAHNPQATRAPDGTYLLMDSYNGPDAGCATKIDYATCKPVGCSSGFHGGNCSCPPKMPHHGQDGGPANFTYHISKSAAGPWSPITVQMEYPCWGLNLTPTPAFHPNGTMYIAFHCDDAMGDVVLVSAPTFRGPFKAVPTRVRCESKRPTGFGVTPHPEDPFLWIASNGGAISFHLVLHDNPRGVHWFSPDGITWHLHQKQDEHGTPIPPHFYDEHIAYTDGTNVTVGRRERPWMLFNADGSPRALVTSIMGGNRKGDASVWTMVQGTSAEA